MPQAVLPTKVVHPDGTITEHFPKNGKKFEYQELRDLLGGSLETVPFMQKRGEYSVAYCDEEGQIKGLEFNPVATRMWLNILAKRGEPLRYQPRLFGPVLLKAPRT